MTKEMKSALVFSSLLFVMIGLIAIATVTTEQQWSRLPDVESCHVYRDDYSNIVIVISNDPVNHTCAVARH